MPALHQALKLPFKDEMMGVGNKTLKTIKCFTLMITVLVMFLFYGDMQKYDGEEALRVMRVFPLPSWKKVMKFKYSRTKK